MKTLYTAHATTTSGREGFTQTDDEKIAVKLSSPNSNEPGTNPEQLFACGYSACFGSALNAVAKKKNVPISELKVTADISLNQDDSGKYFLSAVLNSTLPGVEQESAERLVKEAHQVCPYSQAVRNNIEVKLQANGREVR